MIYTVAQRHFILLNRFSYLFARTHSSFTPITRETVLLDKTEMSNRNTVQSLISDELNLSYSGCGFLGMYHVGVASCFHQYAPQLSMHKITGTSIGSIIACAHICGNPQLALTTHEILRIAIKARSKMLGPFHPSFDINKTLWQALDRGLPQDVHEKASERLHISLTRVKDGKNIIINKFETRQDLMQLIICSCFIPFWSGLTPPMYKGEAYIDGGFSDNLPRINKHTVTVAPFSGESDICPLDRSHNLIQLSMANMSFLISPDNIYKAKCALLPPSPKILSQLCQLGFEDGIRFLQRTNRISCTRCINVREERGTHTLVNINEESINEEEEEECEEEDGEDGTNHYDVNEIERMKRQYFTSIQQSKQLKKRPSSFPLNRICEDEDDGFAEGEDDIMDINTDWSEISEKFKTWPMSYQEKRIESNRYLTASKRESKNIKKTNKKSTVVRPTSKNRESKASMLADSARKITRATLSELMFKIRNNCDDCQERRKMAMFDSLPEQFVQLIQDACHQLEQQLIPSSNITIDETSTGRPLSFRYQIIRFCYTQPWRSILLTPWLLPIDISLLIINRFLKQIPQFTRKPTSLLTSDTLTYLKVLSSVMP